MFAWHYYFIPAYNVIWLRFRQKSNEFSIAVDFLWRLLFRSANLFCEQKTMMIQRYHTIGVILTAFFRKFVCFFGIFLFLRSSIFRIYILPYLYHSLDYLAWCFRFHCLNGISCADLVCLTFNRRLVANSLVIAFCNAHTSQIKCLN